MRVAGLVFVLSALCGPALSADPVLPARLAGHALLPPLALVPPPADAPGDAAVAGKFRGPERQMTPGTLPGVAGIQPPFEGQPVQGLSGFAATRAPDGSIFAISDNGFGRKATSPDVLLQIHRVVPRFEAGDIDVAETLFLSDPHFRVPFRIAYEGTEARYLTGADFDPESIQVADGSFWFGDEFGPWLVRADMAGRIEAVYPVMLDGTEIRSPDHPKVDALSERGRDWQVGRSKGLEGLALHPDTGMLWAMLESPLPQPDGTPGSEVLALAFDPVAARWTGDRMSFRLGVDAVAVGEFNFIDGRHALVIERDNGNGLTTTACSDGTTVACHRNPAKVKRLVVVDTAPVDTATAMARMGVIDLMAIDDPQGRALPDRRGVEGRFTFPFVTIESVMMWDDGLVLVANDNNLPSQDGRDPAAATPTEIIRIDISEALSGILLD